MKLICEVLCENYDLDTLLPFVRVIYFTIWIEIKGMGTLRYIVGKKERNNLNVYPYQNYKGGFLPNCDFISALT